MPLNFPLFRFGPFLRGGTVKSVIFAAGLKFRSSRLFLFTACHLHLPVEKPQVEHFVKCLVLRSSLRLLQIDLSLPD